MATEQKRILVRRGYKADLVVTDLQPGELVLALDTNEIGVKTSGETVLWFATLDANGKAKTTDITFNGVSMTLLFYKIGNLKFVISQDFVNFGIRVDPSGSVVGHTPPGFESSYPVYAFLLESFDTSSGRLVIKTDGQIELYGDNYSNTRNTGGRILGTFYV
jgi:hypothetical protein